MRKIKEILRLHLLGGVSSCRQLARAAGCGKSTVSDCPRRAAEAGLDRWELIGALDEGELERRLYPTSTAPIIRKQRPLPDWTMIREELASICNEAAVASCKRVFGALDATQVQSSCPRGHPRSTDAWA